MEFPKSGLTTGAYYKFTVQAFNIIGDGPQSSEVSIIAATVPGAPAQPTLLIATKELIGIAWNDPIELGGTTLDTFLVQMDGGSSGSTSFTTIATVTNSGTDTYTTIPATLPLVTGDVYTFKVIAQNVVGDSIASPTFS